MAFPPKTKITKAAPKALSQNLEATTRKSAKNNNMALTATPGSTQTPMALKKGGMAKKVEKKADKKSKKK